MQKFFYFEDFTWIDTIDVLLVAIVIYSAYVAISRTRALPVVKAFVLILFLTLLADIFHFNTIKAILSEVRRWMFLMIIVLFPSEVRNWLYSLGKTNFLRKLLNPHKSDIVAKLMQACDEMSRQKIGALIAIEGNDHLQMIAETGTIINADVLSSLIITIFNKTGPLHDGAIIIRGSKIISAGSYIPNISANPDIQNKYGTRHRAGLGLSEQSDAMVVIVSEERKSISFAYQGRLYDDLSIKRLSFRLNEILSRNAANRGKAK